MSLPLIDCRCKITHETHIVLESASRAAGVDRSELIRDVLHEWALKKISEASLLDSLLKREGLGGVVQGVSGSEREREGLRGSGLPRTPSRGG